jgi:signal transduction histidine kinase
MTLNSRPKEWLRTTCGLKATQGIGNWISGPNRELEAGFAIARALVVLSVALLPNPGAVAAASALSKPLVTVYSLYAAALIFVSVSTQRKTAPIFMLFVHTADICWTCAFAVSMRSFEPLLLLFLFPIVTATFRWGPPATLATTLALVAGVEGLTAVMQPGGTGDDLPSLETFALLSLVGILLAHTGESYRQASRARLNEEEQPLPSGTPAQIIQSVVEQTFNRFRPKHIQLLVEEVSSGRAFLWHAEEKKDSTLVVHSEEFDQASADPYWRVMPAGDWMLSHAGDHVSLRTVTVSGRIRTRRNVPAALADFFDAYSTVVAAAVAMSDEWKGWVIICDPSIQGSGRLVLEALREFSNGVARSIHTAQLCLRACRATAANERARLARELHDGVVQSLLGVDLRLEGLKRQTKLPATSSEIVELQVILRGEAKGLRELVSESRRGALRPERLLEYLSDRLERLQRDSGFMTRFFADLDNEAMPPRVCHEIARITEEAIVNAKRHSRGSMLVVRVGCVAGNWTLVIIDDGVGFDFRGVWSLEQLTSSGLGPRVIKERVRSLGAGLLIESTSTGARIEISIPKNQTIRGEPSVHEQWVPVAGLTRSKS